MYSLTIQNILQKISVKTIPSKNVTVALLCQHLGEYKCGESNTQKRNFAISEMLRHADRQRI